MGREGEERGNMNAGQAMLQWLVDFCTKKLLVARVLRHCFTRWNMVHGGCSSVRCEHIGFYVHQVLPPMGHLEA